MNKLTVIGIVIAMFTVANVHAQKAEKTEKWQQVTIQTNGTCQSCKDKIENGLAYDKGVKDVNYELATAKVTVTYNAEKTSVQNLKDAIVKLGFKVDVPATEAKTCAKTCSKPCGSKEAEKPACSGHGHDGHKH
jgi:copper chaperone CopZ